MSSRIDALAQALFQKPNVQECSLQQVEYLAQQYPYFTPAQLLLLKKTENDAEQLHRTALHFSNPLQLQNWISETATNSDPSSDLLQPEVSDLNLFQKPIPVEEVETTAPNRTPLIINVVPVSDREEEIVDDDGETDEKIETTVDADVEPVQQHQAENFKSAPKEIAATETSLETVSSPPETPVPAITFEPYHTVDYFASQGIKLSQQEASSDKLGKQLKSFTEWLKTMKRLPETTAPANADASNERKVETLASHSLDTTDVVTESMAEVWAKQGNREKATDIYNKLSLRNPAKSAYFAVKIESLKTRS